MATLEKIRSKSVLLFVIIIVALLAFILGDFLTSGRTYFSSPTTVAKANGVTVDYQDYNNRTSQLSDYYRQQNANITSDQLSSMALNQLISEGLTNQEYKKLGITVTDTELNQAMFGANQSPAVAQMIAYLSQQIGLQQPSAQGVFDAMQNPARYNISAESANAIRNQWADMEKQVENELLATKFQRLVFPLFTYNKLDAQSAYDNVASTRQISYVMADAASLSDEDVNFSDTDVQNLWNQRRNQYRLDEPTRLVEYIYVALEPTNADKARAAAAVAEALATLNATEGFEAVSANPDFSVQTAKVPLSHVSDNNLKEFLAQAQPGTADQINANDESYTLAKLINVSNEVDSIMVSFVNFEDAAMTDSLVNAMNSGKSAAELTNGINVAGADSIEESLLNPQLPADIAEFLLNAPVGTAVAHPQTANGQQFNAIYKVVKRSAPVPVYDFALVTYDVEASPESLADYAANLRTYVSNNSSADEFATNAANNGYIVQSADVTPSSVAVGRANDRQFVKWAMNAKKGKVSPVFQDDKQTYLVAMAIKDIYSDFRPATDPTIYPQLQMEARNSKKAAQLVENFKDKANSLEDYASLMGATVNEGSVNFSSPVLLNIGMRESALQGAIAAAQEGQLVGPVQGNRGAVVFTVTGIDNSNRPFTAEEYGETFLRNFSPLRSNPTVLLLGNKKIENRSLNFVNAPAE